MTRGTLQDYPAMRLAKYKVSLPQPTNLDPPPGRSTLSNTNARQPRMSLHSSEYLNAAKSLRRNTIKLANILESLTDNCIAFNNSTVRPSPALPGDAIH